MNFRGIFREEKSLFLLFGFRGRTTCSWANDDIANIMDTINTKHKLCRAARSEMLCQSLSKRPVGLVSIVTTLSASASVYMA
ncbi:hypothetical protein Cob_v000581 [Colletotrichum orbiculare MAFF 240422]|uniref:Uncharacterized protein n=1 Tax=Colletotrichum orbiculare (strain 104-T / ATCC 96160 / CBS 514.97 / LARS 414 / MAFF 240422) TaxID=1213857 RepID=A0A484GAL6_COLOR|nr:hypothetical protein Cob_v000581 [Colletotrichum orbiculare MAFF 240422]